MCVCVFSWGEGGRAAFAGRGGGGEFITINRTDDKPRSPVQCKHATEDHMRMLKILNVVHVRVRWTMETLTKLNDPSLMH